jgi:hypothetical protein
MVRAGYNGDEIVAVFAANPHGCGQEYAERGPTHFEWVLQGAHAKAGAA